MRYPFTVFATLVLCVSLIAFCSSKKVETPVTKPIVSNAFTYEHQMITLDDIMASSPDKIEMLDIKVDEPIVQEPPRWVHVRYGNADYAVDENGLYHDRQGRIWKPITVDTTAYTWKDDGNNPSIGAGDGKTSDGKTDAIRTYGIASGSPRVPYGSIIHVSGYGQFKVDDTGGRLRREWKKYGKIRLDLRIPQLRYDGAWRSIRQARAVAFKHGVRRNRMVLMLVK